MTTYDRRQMVLGGLLDYSTKRLPSLFLATERSPRRLYIKLTPVDTRPFTPRPPLSLFLSLAPAIFLCAAYETTTGRSVGSPLVEIFLLSALRSSSSPPHLCPISIPPATSLRWPRHGDAGRTATAPWQACALTKVHG